MPAVIEDSQVDVLLRAPVRSFGWGIFRPEIRSQFAFLTALLRASPFLDATRSNFFLRDDDNRALLNAAHAAHLIIEFLKEKLPVTDHVYIPTIDPGSGLLVDPIQKNPDSYTLNNYLFKKFNKATSDVLLATLFEQDKQFEKRVGELSNRNVRCLKQIEKKPQEMRQPTDK